MNEHFEPHHTAHILLVEDRLSDIILTEKAFSKANFPYQLHTVRDGEEALLFLKKEGRFQNEVRPDLVLLDINLPKKSGYEVLREVKSDHSLRSIPIVILTSSDSEQDITLSYQLYANSYLVKPTSLAEFAETVSVLMRFWFKVVKLLK